MLGKWSKSAIFLSITALSLVHHPDLTAKRSSSDGEVTPAYGPFYQAESSSGTNSEGTNSSYGPFYTDKPQNQSKPQSSKSQSSDDQPKAKSSSKKAKTKSKSDGSTSTAYGPFYQAEASSGSNSEGTNSSYGPFYTDNPQKQSKRQSSKSQSSGDQTNAKSSSQRAETKPKAEGTTPTAYGPFYQADASSESDSEEINSSYGPFYTDKPQKQSKRPSSESQSWGNPPKAKSSSKKAESKPKPKGTTSTAYGPFYVEDSADPSTKKSSNKKSSTQNSYGPFYSNRPQRKKVSYYKIRPLLEVKAGYFFFSDSKMRKIYDQEGLDLQLAATYPVWKWLQIYASAEFIQKQGRSLHGNQRTRIWEYPFTLGLQAVARISQKAQYYFTAGPRYIHLHQHNNSADMARELNHNGVGLFLGTGFHVFPIEHFVIDFFGEYSYCRMHGHPHRKYAFGESAQVGGFVFGGGLGYAF